MIINRTFSLKQFLYFSGAFILFTIIGTVSHELGHIAVAKYRGYQTTLHHASMNYDTRALVEQVNQIYFENEEAIKNGGDFEGKEAYEQKIRDFERDQLLITFGGPIQTMLTGLIGLAMLFYRRRQIQVNGLLLLDWLAVFLSLFWLREVFNLVMSVGDALISGNDFYFGGDERNISEMLDLPLGTIPILFAAIGSIVAIVVVFRIIPLKSRLTFISGGLVGGIIGFVLWIYMLGPAVLP